MPIITSLLKLPENQAKYHTGLLTSLRGLAPEFTTRKDADPRTPPPLPTSESLAPQESWTMGELRRIVDELAAPPYGRNVFHPERLKRCADFLLAECARVAPSRSAVKLQTYTPKIGNTNVAISNYEIEFKGSTRADEIVVIGAHYDSVDLKDSVQQQHHNCPAANDNGSGTAQTLVLADLFLQACRSGFTPHRTVRFVLFANEEPPFFWTDDMGSVVYADACKRRNENIVAMITPETIGYYTDAPNSQRLPFGLLKDHFGTVGNYLHVVGLGDGAAPLMREVCGLFRDSCSIRCVGATLPPAIPYVGASDHWSFWRRGYPALMVSDGGPFRFQHYHQWLDKPETFHWPAFARVTVGLDAVVRGLACPKEPRIP